jgi:glycosyltransferase involved in cell wall biosynthesis
MPEFLNANLALISNRVKKLKVSNEAVISKNAETTFIAISRIGLAYTPNLCKAIKLISKLSFEFDVELIIIGTVESEQNLKELTDLVNDDIKVRILTSEDYTKEASRFLPNADITINSGRGVMESCSLGLPSLCYAKNLDIPVLLDEVSFDTLFENNFSPRSFVLNDDENDQLSKIKTIITDKESRKKASSFSMEAFEEHFNLENALSKYNSFYENAKSWDFKSAKYLIWIFRSFYKSYRRV